MEVEAVKKPFGPHERTVYDYGLPLTPPGIEVLDGRKLVL